MSRRREPYLIPGYHPVCEALSRPGCGVMEVWIAGDRRSKRARTVLSLAEDGDVPIRSRTAGELDDRFPDTAHQGFAAVVQAPEYADLEELVEASLKTPGRGLLVAADHITDEGNLGALIRTAAFFGAAGLVIPRDRAAGLGERVAKRSAGASLLLPVAREVNLVRALDRLDQAGFWIIGAAGEAAADVYGFDWVRDTVLVVGSEDRGLAPNVRAHCHEIVAIPGSGRVASLNVAVAAGAILSEIVRQRMRAGGSL
ncbi:MAG: 23S rRNA (guanosine(2251)-2'-O)-methyltransferase RlmB [Deltaproteobacteria bacterium]|nr:23S rRNA (guanosine(2251)-2'-O)-methyltransferase RlmB [Deltaproteobacteria bacterium]